MRTLPSMMCVAVFSALLAGCGGAPKHFVADVPNTRPSPRQPDETVDVSVELPTGWVWSDREHVPEGFAAQLEHDYEGAVVMFDIAPAEGTLQKETADLRQSFVNTGYTVSGLQTSAGDPTWMGFGLAQGTESGYVGRWHCGKNGEVTVTLMGKWPQESGGDAIHDFMIIAQTLVCK